MKRKPKTLQEKMIHVEAIGNDLLAEANEANERGDKEKAEHLYEKGQAYFNRYRSLESRLIKKEGKGLA
jgi:hypothetical protein